MFLVLMLTSFTSTEQEALLALLPKGPLYSRRTQLVRFRSSGQHISQHVSIPPAPFLSRCDVRVDPADARMCFIPLFTRLDMQF